MKKLIMILFALVMMSATAFGQAQDTLDFGGPDSIIMVVSQPDVDGFDSSIVASLYFVNDVQNLASASVGFEWDNPKMVLDSTAFSPAADAGFNFIKLTLYKSNLDSTNANRLFQFSGSRFSPGVSFTNDPNRQLVCTYWFHVEGWDVNDSVVIDTNTFGGGVNKKFVDDDTLSNQYVPFWGQGSTIKDVSGIIDLSRSGDLPTAFAVRQNYPNPFNPTTNIEFDVPVSTKVNISVFNVLGQRVTTLVNEEMPAGSYSVDWNGGSDSGNRVASGIYFYRITAGDFVKTKKMMMLK